MASSASQGRNLLHGFKKLGKFDTGIGAQLPEAYKKFWNEWKTKTPVAVHFVPKEGLFESDEITGIVRPIQNVPIPVKYPVEHNAGIWGGEGVVKGFIKRNPYKRRTPHFWVPVLRRSVVRSVILDQCLSMTITDRTLELIHESCGFDHYILKTPACDLKSILALKLKRKLLEELHSGCKALSKNPTKQKEILNEYKKYLDQYTAEEIDWYGLTFMQAITKLETKNELENPIVPYKVEFRKKLIEQLKKANLGSKTADNDQFDLDDRDAAAIRNTSSSWISKINPFGKKQET